MIERIELRRVRLPLVHRFQTSSHAKRELEHILVTVFDSDGAAGWGEIASPSGPFYSAETVESCWAVARDHLAPVLLRSGAEEPPVVRGNHFARAGFDMALWDLRTRRQGVSLAEALGGVRATVEAGVSLGIEPTIDDLLEQVALRVSEGYRRIKLKIAPGWDIKPVQAVKATYPDLAVQVDANGAYCRGEMSVFRQLDNQRLLMIEQPYPPRDLLAHADLQKQIETPVCLDESIEEIGDLTTALHLNAARIINIKVSRMGGLTTAVQAHDLARDHGIPVWCGGMHEFGIGRAANVALSSLPGFTLPSDVSGSAKYYARDVTTEPIVCHDGFVRVPQSPGLGFEPDPDFITAHTTAAANFS